MSEQLAPSCWECNYSIGAHWTVIVEFLAHGYEQQTGERRDRIGLVCHKLQRVDPLPCTLHPAMRGSK